MADSGGGIVWLASYPKSGNTWLRIFLGNLEASSDQPVDINRLTFGLVASHRTWLDEVLALPTAEFSDDEIDRLRPTAYDWAAQDYGPALHLKVHDAYRMIDPHTPLIGSRRSRAIYLVRNPLDLVLSYSTHLGRTVDRTIGLMADPEHALAASDIALRRQVRQRLLTWSRHVASWLEADGVERHVVRYEDLIERPQETFAAIVDFLGWPRSRDQIARAVALSAFGRLQRLEAAGGFDERPPGVGSFFRSGRSGEWRERLTHGQISRIVADHGSVMRQLGYLDACGRPT